MNDVTRILTAIEAGEPQAAEQLLPLVYEELRRLAAQKLAHEKPGQTLQATALVHEAYLRLVASVEPSGGRDDENQATSGLRLDAREGFNTRGHFFAAAAEAMRRILVENARRKSRHKHGGGRKRIDFDEALLVSEPADPLLDLDEALTRLAAIDPLAAKLVTLRYFSGLTMPETAAALGISLRNAERNWTYAKTWLHRELAGKD